MSYDHVLVALDLAEDIERVLDKASTYKDRKMSLVHVVRPIEHVYGGFGAIGVAGDYSAEMATLERKAQEQAKEKLAEAAKTLGVPEERQYVRVGNPATEIHHLAEDEGVDLIVMGTHGRHGLGLLLGSTANAVLHGVKCDVLAVRIGEMGED
jgi:universal stress protein A